jgi:outer membrane protein assembly factor BamB
LTRLARRAHSQRGRVRVEPGAEGVLVRLRLLVLTAVVALTAAACGPVDWVMFRFGPAHTGSSSDTTISKDAVQSSMVLNWTGTLGSESFSSPAIAQGVVYIGAQDGKFYAFDAAGAANCSGTPKSCAPLWTGGPGGSENAFASSPAVVGGVVYVGSLNGMLYAFDAAGNTNCSGNPKICAPLWTGSTGGDVFSPPTVDRGVVYVASDDGNLHAFDAAGSTNCSGTPKVCAPLWTGNLMGTNQNHASPAVAGGVVYVTIGAVEPTGEEFTGLLAFDAAGNTSCSGIPKTCNSLWSATLSDNFVVSSPAVAGGVVYVGNGDGALHAFDAANGTRLWTAPTGAGVQSSPAVANGVVYVGSTDNKLYAFDAAGNTNCSGSPKTCASLWTATSGGDIVSSPAVANGVVYVGSFDHKLYAFDAAGNTNCSGNPKTCQPLWMVTTGAELISSPAVSRGAVYVGSHDRKLYAFGLEKVPPTTSILIPSDGATLSGTTTLDATAADNVKVSRVEFRLTGGNYNNALIGVATATYFGWIAQWDTTSVPNGAYTLNSVALDPANNSGRSANVNITVQK